MPKGEYIQDTKSGTFWRKEALKAKKEYEEKKEASGKQYKMVKVSDCPPTWIEVEVGSEKECELKPSTVDFEFEDDEVFELGLVD